VSPADFDTFLTLVEILKAAGWTIAKFEDLGGAVTLTIVPHKREAAGAE
jgi:hypothetical protein